jgi:hypothetical protein
MGMVMGSPNSRRHYLSNFNNLDMGLGGGGRIRTSVLIRGQIYSLLPLTTRPPLHWGTRRDQAIVGWRKRVSVLGTGGRTVNSGGR